MINSRKFGLDFVGNMSWGTHLCLFYETKEDLKDILVPYFAEGLRSNEACIWVTSEPLGAAEATAALAKAVPNLDRFIKTGQLLVLPYTEWYLKDGTFDAEQALLGWVEKEREAFRKGFDGLRLTGNTFWIERSLWNAFTDYEDAVNNVIGNHRMIAVCTYNLGKCTGNDVMDVMRNHVGTIIKKGEAWSVIEDVTRRKEAETALKTSEKRFKALFEDSPVAQVRYDVEGRAVEANKAAYTFLGIASIADVQQWTIFTSPRVPDAGKAELRAGNPIHYELEYDFSALDKADYFSSSRSDVRYADVQNAPLFDSDGNITGYLSQLVDITDRKRAQEERESVAKFPAENPHPVLRLSYEGEMLYANAAGQEFLKNPHFTLNELRDRIEQARASEKEFTTEITVGTKIFQLFIIPLVDSNYANIYVTDVTESKTAEEALYEAVGTVHTLNKKLRSANEELQIVNEELDIRVKERSAELANVNEELMQANKALSVSNKELRQEAQNRTNAEKSARFSADRTAALNEIIRAINEAVSQDALFDRTLTAIMERLEFQMGLIATVADNGFLNVRCARNVPDALIEAAKNVHVEDDPYGRAMYRQSEVFVVDDVTPDFPSYHFGLRGAFVGIPFLSQDEVVGGVLLNGVARSFTSEDRELFSTIGLEFGTAITKLRAKEQLARESTINSALADLTKTLLSPTRDPEAMSAVILSEAKRLTGSKHGFMVFLDPETKDMIGYGHTEIPLDECAIPQEKRQIRFPIGADGTYHTLATHAVNEKKGFYTNHPAQHPASTGAPEGHVPLEQFLAAPALIGGEVVGEIALANPGRDYTDGDVLVVERLAEIYALSVMRMRVDENEREHAQRSETLRQIIVAGNQATVLQSAAAVMVDTTMDMLDFDSGGIFLRDGEAVAAQYLRGYTPEQHAWAQRLPITQSRVAHVMAGRPWISEDYQADVSFEAKEMNKDVVSMATIPLVSGYKVIGFYQLADSRKTHRFSESDVELLVSVGQEAGTVIGRLLVEEALKESEARYRSLVERNFDGVMIHSDGIIRFANKAAVRIMNVSSSEELVGKSAIELSTPEYRELLTERVMDIYRTRESSDLIEIQTNTPDGTIVDIELSGTLIIYEGKPAIYVIARDISERKRMEARLKKYADHLEDLVEERTVQLAESEEYFRTLFEESSIAQVRYDAEGRPTDINSAALMLFGISNFADIRDISIQESQRIPEQSKTLLFEGNHIRYEDTYDFAALRESGYFPTSRSDVRHVDVFMFPLIDRSTKAITGYLAQIADITERKEAEAALKTSELQYRTLVETANSLIFALDTEGTITYVNDYGAEHLDYTPDELIGQNVMIIVPDKESSGRDMTPYISDIVAHPDEHVESINENVTKDGQRLWSHWVNKGLTDEEGRHIGHLAIGNDVTEQLRVQRALQESEERYRTLVETAHSIILTIDATGVITFINDYGARFLGYAPEELVGKHTMILVPPVESSGRDLTAHINAVIAHPDQHSVSLNENVTKEGRRVLINWVNHMLTDKEGHHVGHLTMGYDVTEQKRAEDALHDAQRLAGIGETAAMIGHDLRNPLQGLQYIVDLQNLRFDRMSNVQRQDDDWQKAKQLFDKISEQVYYMDKIVGDLQDYARPLDPEREIISLQKLIEDVFQSLPGISSGVEFNAALPDITIEAEPHLMHRVFSNLFLNAIQAMPDGGTLTVTAASEDGLVAISVGDTGVGIPVEMKKKLFSPLMTGKAKGTGLGLAVVKRIVDAHGGTITFDSEEGNGTTFTVTLPQHSFT
ncbi:MAG: PAS domain S-box protein [Halobacteriota archaeon]